MNRYLLSPQALEDSQNIVRQLLDTDWANYRAKNHEIWAQLPDSVFQAPNVMDIIQYHASKAADILRYEQKSVLDHGIFIPSENKRRIQDNEGSVGFHAYAITSLCSPDRSTVSNEYHHWVKNLINDRINAAIQATLAVQNTQADDLAL